MKLEEILAAYPACPTIIRLVENPDKAELWERKRAAGVSAQQIIEQHKIRNNWNDRMSDDVATVILAELDTPDALRYFRAKLGEL